MAFDIIVLYGSQTGNAEDMARRIGFMAKSKGYTVLVEAMDDFQLKHLASQEIALFVCSTTGHGQEPENMKTFYNFIRRRDLPSNCLTNLNYAVFGLGDSSYAKFNWVSKVLFKRLKECGANPMQSLTVGDEQHPYGCDGVIYPKLDELWTVIEGKIESGDKLDAKSTNSIPPSSYQVTFSEYDQIHTKESENIFKDEFVSKYNIKTAHCYRNERITAEPHFQDTRFLCFNTQDSLVFEPGDVCTIFPANADQNVEKFAELLALDLDKRVAAVKNDPSYMVNYLYDFIPHNSTVRNLIKYYFDIQSVPKRSFFEFLWPFSENDLERSKLKEFASTEGQEELYEYCVLPKRSILEVLMDFPHTINNIKFEYLLDMIPPIKPRSFSIASAVSQFPGEIHLIIGVVRYKTRMRKIRLGLCSNYLANLSQDSLEKENYIRFFLNRTSFKLPVEKQKPIIMVGPGLGIAPFRSFLQERIDCDNLSRNYLYFGCRSYDADFYFKEELAQYVDSSKLDLKVAFSREQQKQYVQSLIKIDSNLIFDLISNKGAILYVAGNSKLPEELRKLMTEIFKDLGEESGEKIVSILENENRLQYDCW